MMGLELLIYENKTWCRLKNIVHEYTIFWLFFLESTVQLIVSVKSNLQGSMCHNLRTLLSERGELPTCFFFFFFPRDPRYSEKRGIVEPNGKDFHNSIHMEHKIRSP